MNFLIAQYSRLIPTQKSEGKLRSLKFSVLHVCPCCGFSTPTASKYGSMELVYANMTQVIKAFSHLFVMPGV